MARVTHIGSQGRNRLSLTPFWFKASPTQAGPDAPVGPTPHAERRPGPPAGPYRSQSSNPKIRSEATPQEKRVAPYKPPAPSSTGPSTAPHTPDLVSLLTNPLGTLRSALSGSGSPLSIPTPPVVVPKPLEQKTLGAPSLEELLSAGRTGTLRLNAGGAITIPSTRAAVRGLRRASSLLAQTTGIQSPSLTAPQRAFAEELARQTDLSPRVTGAWTAREGGNSLGDFNYLNIGQTDTGPNAAAYNPAFQSPKSAADATAAFLKQAPGAPTAGAAIPQILSRARGKSPVQQAHIIAGSGWATDPNYEGPLQQLVSETKIKRNPEAVKAFHIAAKNARAVGINPTPYNGDVERGPSANTVFVRADAQGMVHWAESAAGTPEGSSKQLRWAANEGLSSSQPWCANFISNGLARRGIAPPPNPNWVPSYEHEWSGGRNIGTNLAKAKPGDLIAFSGEHIGLYVGNGEMISGNFGNQVARSAVSAGPAPVSAILRPNYKGGRVAVHESTPLPGSSPTTAFASGAGAAGTAATSTLAAQRQLAPISPLSSPFSAGPVMPAGYGGAESAPLNSAEELLALLRSGRRSSRGLYSA